MDGATISVRPSPRTSRFRRARGPVPAALLLASLLAACAGEGPGAGGALPAPCPGCNVVLVSVDTLRADRVGAYGYPRPTTPNLDALAARGVLFENAISQSSWTRPAHMSLFTGLHPREHGFVTLADTRPLEDGVPTLASVLKERGYHTAGFTGGVNLGAHYGFGRGFDVYRTNGKYFRDNLEDFRYWLDHRPGDARPFFLFLHGYDAHTPYLTDPVDRQALALAAAPPEATLADTCRAGGERSRVEPFLREYEGAVHRADRYVGKMLRELEGRGMLERTVVVVLSDHGEEFLEHDRCFHVATVYREAVHVPLVFVSPGLEPRRVPGAVSASVPIAATILDMIGVAGHPLPGVSLLDAARGRGVPPDPIVSETERNAPKKGDGHVRALTTEDFRLLHWTTQQRSALFDAKADQLEAAPIDDATTRDGLVSELDRWAAAHAPRFPARRRAGATSPGKGPGKAGDRAADQAADPPRAEEPGVDDAELRRREQELRALGYMD